MIMCLSADTNGSARNGVKGLWGSSIKTYSVSPCGVDYMSKETDTVNISNSPRSEEVSPPFKSSRGIVSAAWWFTLARYTMSNSSSGSLRRQRVILPVLLVMMSIQRTVSSSVLTVKRVLSKYGWSIVTAQEAAKFASCVVASSRCLYEKVQVATLIYGTLRNIAIDFSKTLTHILAGDDSVIIIMHRVRKVKSRSSSKNYIDLRNPHTLKYLANC